MQLLHFLCDGRQSLFFRRRRGGDFLIGSCVNLIRMLCRYLSNGPTVGARSARVTFFRSSMAWWEIAAVTSWRPGTSGTGSVPTNLRPVSVMVTPLHLSKPSVSPHLPGPYNPLISVLSVKLKTRFVLYIGTITGQLWIFGSSNSQLRKTLERIVQPTDRMSYFSGGRYGTCLPSALAELNRNQLKSAVS
jgi:hypothetical protein